MKILNKNLKFTFYSDTVEDFNLDNYYLKRKRSLFTAHTKTRSEVRGTTKKAFKQKGTGRARAGSSKTPLKPGGGIIFGPKFRGKIKLKLNKKSIFNYKLSVLSRLSQSKNLCEITYTDTSKTKDIIKNLELIDNKHYLILSSAKNLEHYSSNIKNLECKVFNDLNFEKLNKYNTVFIDSFLWNSFKEKDSEKSI